MKVKTSIKVVEKNKKRLAQFESLKKFKDDGLTQKEVSESLGISIRTVKRYWNKQ
ncbi:MAG: winged helix-turn-helix transcriptional regulator [Shewanella sp.]|uniref:winged helix-turn-helix transcriptional regulator n=1 Tax=Shewanella sp. TaxID=50422 RepID=UPI0026491ECE|nr:winged helix-turn-helix transcriptional regulator [Shewanella sp.]MDN5501014.1 winged helix-turn-helix transcriptional regulator [Shewanella sp.]MDN5529041.1 winged helix-turn-helix transcriptional regulator [Shewanella sp.]